MDYFLHVLFIDDADAKQLDPNSAKMTKNGKNAELSVAGWNLTFPFAKDGIALIERSE